MNFMTGTTGMVSATQLPNTKPREDPENLKKFQSELLKMVQYILGPCDPSKEINLQPEFVDDDTRQPHTWMYPNGAWGIKLSRNAECNWAEVIFQMAHEIVHLLNPVLKGCSNYLEEGIAVAFSYHVQQFYGIKVEIKKSSPNTPKYQYALQLVQELPSGPLKAGGQIREKNWLAQRRYCTESGKVVSECSQNHLERAG